MDPKTIVILIVVSAADTCAFDNIDRLNTNHMNMPDMEYCQNVASMMDPVQGQSAFCIEVK